jgi:hypothetical protein
MLAVSAAIREVTPAATVNGAPVLAGGFAADFL